MIPINPNTYDGYKLMQEGILALTDIEQNGIPIDVKYCEKQYDLLQRKIEHTRKKLQKNEDVKYWKNKYKSKFNLESGEQLAHVLFDHLGYKPQILTEKGNYSTSQQALEQIDHPIVSEISNLQKTIKARNTYIKNILQEQVDGLLHPFFNLHIARTFRSSSSNPNFQNIPTRIDWVKKLIRQSIIPLPGFMLGEIDFSGVEVRGAACYNKDPILIADIIDPTRDMHRDMAMECYILSEDEWTKQTRYCGKNKFVFPQFYGDYYVNCARSLWDAIHIMNLTTRQGISLKKHLRDQGISSYLRFESHIKDVEDRFWNERYKVYNTWKEQHWESYQKNAFVDLKTGFRCSGYMTRNEAINYPIQGSAFHCLLWCLIELNKWLKDTNKKTKIIGQIHDSIVLMIWPAELNVVLRKAYRIMEVEIRKHWPWIIVPLEVETEVSPVNGSWYLKKEIKQNKCKCGSNWMYKNEVGNNIVWECPICNFRD